MNSEIPLVAEHDTWISLDPLLGCPARCEYCYLLPLGETARSPVVRVSPRELADELRRFFVTRGSSTWGRGREPVPVSLGNYTDMFMTGDGHDYAIRYAKEHAARFADHPLCLITKARLTPDVLNALEHTGARVLFFFSQSFLSEGASVVEKGPTCRPAETVANIRLVRAHTSFAPIHFWRPLTYSSARSADDVRRQMALMQGAGAMASVVVGLKGHYHTPASGLTNQVTREWVGDEVLADELIDWVWSAAHELQYPVYRNTSCAIALATQAEESLGTWRDGLRAERCSPCMCPRLQREKCEMARAADAPPEEAELLRVQTNMQLESASLSWDVDLRSVAYRASLSQDQHTTLTHLIGHPVRAEHVERRRAWGGAIIPATAANNDPIGSPEEFGFSSMVRRLDRITGFVTTLHRDDDPRPLAFGRGYHIRRVMTVAKLILDREHLDSSDVRRNVARLVWLHDLNRWPFAHNGERGRYSQDADLERYLNDHGVVLYPGELRDLHSIVRRSPSDGSAAAVIVFAADSIGGMVEDPLLAIMGLNLHPSEIPDEVVKVLRLPDDQEGTDRMAEINRTFFMSRDVPRFVAAFERVFVSVVHDLLLTLPPIDAAFLEGDVFREIHRAVRRDFMEHELFPLNNQKVAHASVLRELVINPLTTHFGADAARHLTTLDEPGAVRAAMEADLFDARSSELLYPDLDYISRSEPERAFRRE
jgi:hypothetical protein